MGSHNTWPWDYHPKAAQDDVVSFYHINGNSLVSNKEKKSRGRRLTKQTMQNKCCSYVICTTYENFKYIIFYVSATFHNASSVRHIYLKILANPRSLMFYDPVMSKICKRLYLGRRVFFLFSLPSFS